jgi:hypothetical protein
MIELNLTYEESKKILDLGYDFSKVSSEFRFPGEEKIKYILVCRYKDGDVELYSSENHDTEIYSTQEFGITPIIPKAALEVCLPATLNILDYLGNLDLSSFAKRFSCEVIDLYSIMQEGVTHEWFTTAFEAFMWCHEKHPEELKAKFDEVSK